MKPRPDDDSGMRAPTPTLGKGNRTIRLICFLNLFLCTSSFALPRDRSISQFQHTAWGEKEGAPSAVQALAQTSDGFLWLGTSDGLYRFDGMTFEPFKPPAWSAFPVLDVRSLLALPDGSLWVGFSFGVVSVIRDGSVRDYGAADGMPGRVVNLAQDRERTMWAATTAGLARLEGNRWKVVGKDWNFPGKAAYGMFVDRQGTLWVASENTIVFLPAGAREFKPTGAHVGAVWQFAEAKNGKLWMAETTRSVRPVPLNTEQRPPDDTEVRVGSVAMLFDRDGALWITTLGDGVRRAPAPEMLHGKIGEFSTAVESFTSKDGLSNDSVNAILQDREGNIWVGTHKGLDRFRKTNLIPIALPSQVYQLAADDAGDIWVWTNHMIRMNEGRAYHLSRNRFGDSLSEGSYRGPDGITWWVGMYGIYRFERGRFSRLPLPKELPTPYEKGVYVAEDRSHGLWAAVERDGVFHLKNGKWAKFNAGPEVGKSHPEAAFTDWIGRVWFGYEGGSIVILNGTTVEKVFPSQESPVGGIRAIAGGSGHVWEGGDLGLAFFQGGRFHPVIPMDAPQFRTVFSILEASGGDLWLCESRGVIHISSAEVQKVLDNPAYRVKYELFDSSDGLPGTFRDAGRLSKVVQATDGRLWFVASDGIAWLDPGHISRNLLPPPVAIESLTADDKRYPYRASPALPPLTSHLEIKFAALSLSNPEQDHFRYKLEGYDKDWRDAGTQRQASYTNLSPRKYRFRVIASNNDGVWNEQGASLDFSIVPAYYQTIWFHTLCVLAFLAFLWAAYKIRVRQLRNQERKFREALETIPALAFIARQDSQCTFVSGRWTEYTGLSEEQALGSGWQAAVHLDDLSQFLKRWQESAASGNALEYETRVRGGKDGGYRWFQTRAVPMRDKRGKIVKWYGVMNDIEDRKRAEQLQADLAHVSRVSTMGELTASLAHEIKQPIGAAVTNAEACLRFLDGGRDALEAREAALEMIRDSRRAADIIDRVRSLYRKESSHMDIVDVNEVVGEMLVILHNEANRHSITMCADLAEGLPKVMADRVQIQQVLMNLMMNGIEAMRNAGGELSIESQLAEDGQLLISVTDAGVGLPTEKTDQIFNAFFTTKPQGTGLGLAITRSIVESHGGRVWATANSGRGTTFQFTLPQQRAAHA